MPFGLQARFLTQAGEFLGQRQSEERDKHMAADSGIGLMEDGTGIEARLGNPEQGLELKQVTVADEGLQRSDPGLGAQHADTAVAGLVGKFAHAYLERLAAGLEKGAEG